ncbi:MAG: FAD-dependent oxidoreductase [Deltaproteobacteria bacterium]|nr:FAD-dependent oxidoreductase [Deltaproteobacteria bacterium]
MWAAQRIQLLSLTQAIKKALFDGGGSPRTYVSKFWYPRRGIGRITQRVADRVRRQGGVIKLSQPVEKIEKIETGYRVHAKGEQFEAERVVSTIPVPLLARLLGESVDKSRLAYRSLRCVFLLVNKDRVTDDTWIYTPDRGTIFGRIHEPKNWSPEMVPGKGTSLCLEVFCTEGDELWNLPSDELHRRCVADLERLGFLRADEVGDAHDIKVKNAYPVFLVGYEKDLAQTADRIARHDGVYLVGRTGAYTYINMDQVIADVLRLADRLVDGA